MTSYALSYCLRVRFGLSVGENEIPRDGERREGRSKGRSHVSYSWKNGTGEWKWEGRDLSTYALYFSVVHRAGIAPRHGVFQVNSGIDRERKLLVPLFDR